MGQFIAISIGVFLSLIILVVIVLLVAKKYLSPSGNVNIEINGDRTISVAQGNSLMSTLNENGVFLPSACGGKASCGQCKVQVLEGGGEILDSEKPHFSRKEIKAGWRLGCQCKVKGDLKIHVDESILGVKEYECTVISNKNVATFIKEFKVQLPAGAHMDFLPGSYAQISVRTPNPPFVPTQWPTIRQRATSSCSRFELLRHRSSPTAQASWRLTQVLPRHTSSRSNRATKSSCRVLTATSTHTSTQSAK